MVSNWMFPSILCIIRMTCLMSGNMVTVNTDWLFNQAKPSTALTTSLKNLISVQNILKCPVLGRKSSSVFVVQDHATWRLAADFQEDMLIVRPDSIFLSAQIFSNFPGLSINAAVQTLDSHINDIHTVALFLDDENMIIQFMHSVCSYVSFKWTHLLHTTEWILASTNEELLVILEDNQFCPDFFTIFVFRNNNQIISHKARNMELFDTVNRNSNNAWTTDDYELYFKDLTSSKQCGISGLHLPAAFLPGVRKYTDVHKVDNVTTYDGYAVAFMSILSYTLKFSYRLVIPTDDGDYGFVYENGSAVGLTGLLTRRETAFCTMGMSKTENRLQAIDYVDTPILYEPVQVTYKLPKMGNQLDLTLMDIIQPEFFLSLVGPCLGLAVIGLLVHFLTRSCTVATPTCSFREIRNLKSFPNHIWFHTTNKYAGHTGRILRGTWGVFCVIFCAAYSAYLVTSFTIKTGELKIDSVQKLLELSSSYKFNVWESNSALLALLQTSKDVNVKELWRKLEAFKRSDPRTISDNLTEHVVLVLSGAHALIDHLRRDDIPLYINSETSEVRSYILHSFDSLADGFLTLPRNAFYKQELNLAVMKLEEAGVLRYLREKYDITQANDITSSTLQTKASVPILRIVIVMYGTLGGVAVSALVLLVEVLLVRAKVKFITNFFKN